MVVVLAHITVVAGREALFERTARALAAATLQHEPGIRRYEYLRLTEPGSYLATLAFADYEAFLEHQSSQHHVLLAGAMSDMIATIRLERVDPVPGCSPLASPADADADAADSFAPAGEAELAARREKYRERYPLLPANWWATPT